VSCVSQSTGQGTRPRFARILRRSGCGGERIRGTRATRNLPVVGNGTGGSRSLYRRGQRSEAPGTETDRRPRSPPAGQR